MARFPLPVILVGLLAQVHTMHRRPLVAQQITWLYANSLSKGASFLGALGFREVNGTLQQSSCRIFHAAPGSFLGVCDTRPAPRCPDGPEAGQSPPVTHTLVVPTARDVDEWHAHLVSVGAAVVTTAPEHSARFGCYAFNYYDADRAHGLGCYRFEVQAFEDPAWPKPQCPPIAGDPADDPADMIASRAASAGASIVTAQAASVGASTVAVPTAASAGASIVPAPALPSTGVSPARVTLDLFVASLCPDAARCERMLEPVLEAVGELVELRLGFIGETPTNGSSPSATRCLHGTSECVGDTVQLCTQQHWPSHVNVEVHRLAAHLNWALFLRCVNEVADGTRRPFNHTRDAAIPSNTHSCLQRHAIAWHVYTS